LGKTALGEGLMSRVSHKSSLTWKNIILFAGIRIFRKGRKWSISMPVALTQGQLKKFVVVIPTDHDPETISRIYSRFFERPGMLTPTNFNWWRKRQVVLAKITSKSTQIGEEDCTSNCIPRRHVYTRQCKSQISNILHTFRTRIPRYRSPSLVLWMVLVTMSPRGRYNV
jgi:hypothetical protein